MVVGDVIRPPCAPLSWELGPMGKVRTGYSLVDYEPHAGQRESPFVWHKLASTLDLTISPLSWGCLFPGRILHTRTLLRSIICKDSARVTLRAARVQLADRSFRVPPQRMHPVICYTPYRPSLPSSHPQRGVPTASHLLTVASTLSDFLDDLLHQHDYQQ